MQAEVIHLAAGRDHSLALYRDAVLVGWGGDGTGRFPLPAGVCAPPSSPDDAVYISHHIELAQIAASAGVSLALDRAGQAYAWGANRAGLGGQIQSITQSQPRALAGLPPLRHISGSEFFTLACTQEGALYHWGLEPGSQHSVNRRPARVSPAPHTVQCVSGGSHALLLDKNRNVWAWGANTSGQLGLAHLQDQNQPIQIPALSKIQRIAAATSHSLALSHQGEVWGWGSNHHGQLGDQRQAFYEAPHKLAMPEAITAIAAGMHVSYALGRSGRAYAWGWNAKGQLGQGHQQAMPGIHHVNLPKSVQQLAAGQSHVLVSNGTHVWGWGDNVSRQLGADTQLALKPVLFPTLFPSV